MLKKFIEWCTKKIETERKKIPVHFKKRDIWWGRICENIGFEQSGKGRDFLRPILVFRKFNNRVFWGIPLTKTQKKGKFYFEFKFCKSFKSVAILSQLRLFDAKRLEEKMGVMPLESFKDLEKAVQEIMDDF